MNASNDSIVDNLEILLNDIDLTEVLYDSRYFAILVKRITTDTNISEKTVSFVLKRIICQVIKKVDNKKSGLIGDFLTKAGDIFKSIENKHIAEIQEYLHNELEKIVGELKDRDKFKAQLKDSNSYQYLSLELQSFDLLFKKNQKILDLLTPQPILGFDVIDNLSSDYQFDYKKEYHKFQGREKELDNLSEFLTQDENFKWHLLTGVAGAGKSRLALEFSHRNGNIWRIGLIKPNDFQDFSWQNWQVESPTLVIIDYVNRIEVDKLISVIEGLNNRAESLQNKVRFLLIDRPSYEYSPWWLNIDKSLAAKNAFDGVLSLENASLSQSILKEELSCSALLKKGQEALSLIDERHQRPLIALLICFLIKRDNLIVIENQYEILSLIIRQLYFATQQYGIADEYYNLLTLATMSEGLSDQDMVLFSNPLLLDASKISDIEITKLLGTTTKYEGIIPPILPDLLGEFFVIYILDKHFKKTINKIEKEKFNQNIGEIIQLIWQHKASKYTSFLLRLIEDFRYYKCDNFDWTILLTTVPESEIGRIYWMNLLLPSSYYLYEKHSEVVELLFKESFNITEEIKNIELKAKIQLTQAKAAFNLTTLCRNKNPLKAEKYYQKILTLIEALDQNTLVSVRAEIQLDQAKAAFNLTTVCGNKNPLKAEKYYQDLITLIEALDINTPANIKAEIQLAQAKIIVTLIAYCGNENLAKAEEYYQDLLRLIEALDKDTSIGIKAEIQLTQAEAISNWIIHCNSKNLLNAEEYFKDFSTLINEDTPIGIKAKIQSRQAEAAFNLTNYYKNNKNLPKIEKYYQELVALIGVLDEHTPVDIKEEIVSKHARTALDLITFYSTIVDVEIVVGYLIGLEKLLPQMSNTGEKQTITTILKKLKDE